jgi:hypothetical protein
MGAEQTAAELTSQLARGHRVLMLGGLAVVGHGLSRSTFDSDVWLDPDLPVGEWCHAVRSITAGQSRLQIVSIGNWKNVPEKDFPEVIDRDGVVRIIGLNQPLDIFRTPNQLDPAEFNEIWNRGEILDDGTRLPDPIDLLVSKQETGREKDQTDIIFLEGKIQADYLARLPHASRDEAVRMLERFLTPRVAEAALAHSDPAVRDLGLRFLRELAQEGDPFAAEILRKIVA